MNNENLSFKLTEFTHGLFTLSEYSTWRNELARKKKDQWFSLVVELDGVQAPIGRLKGFGKDVYSKMVFRCIEAPNFKDSNQIMILFSLSGSSWNSVIYQADNKNGYE